jgi:serine/threonine protein kinase
MTEAGGTGTAALGGELVGGRYRLREILGAGGMGRVWLAEDQLLRRPVAVKEMLGPAADRVDVQLRTVREARAAARLDHPGVVTVYDVVWRDGRAWIVMEYVPSRSLHEAIQADGPLDHRAAARIGLRVLAALRAAHAARVLHLDVKPHNVLLGTDGRVVLGDFGLALTPESDDGPEPEIMGSPFYVAPERISSPPTRPSPATDLWSLGATLYAATEGRAPFLRPTTEASLEAVLRDEPDPVRRPGPLTPVVLDLLTKERDRRPRPADLERRLRGIAEDTAPRPHRPGFPARGSAPVPRAQSAAHSSRADPAAVSSRADPAAPSPQADPAALSPRASPAALSPRADPAPPRRGRRRVLVAGGAAALVLGAGGATILFDSQRAPAERLSMRPNIATATMVPPAAADACGSGARVGPVTPATTRVPAGLPPGWEWFRDSTGFTLALPAGWRRSASGTQVCFEDAAGEVAFTVDSAALVTRRPLDYLRSQEKAATLPGYHRISMDVLLLRRGGADWEYTWRPDSDTTQHVRRVLLAVTDHRSYLLKWATSDAAWARGLRLERQLVNLFDSAP